MSSTTHLRRVLFIAAGALFMAACSSNASAPITPTAPNTSVPPTNTSVPPTDTAAPPTDTSVPDSDSSAPVTATISTAAFGGNQVNVALDTFSIKPDVSTTAAGDVTFHVSNQAKDLTHEMVLIQTDLTSDKLPLDDKGNVDENKLGGKGEVDDLEAGKSGDLQVNLAPGHYVLICNVPGHYKAGMHADFTVSGPTSTGGGPTTASGASKSTVNVALNTFTISPDATTVPSGTVTFHVNNQAKDLTHEMVLIQTDLTADKLPLDDKGNVDEAKLSGKGEVDDLEAGKSGDLQVNLAPGHYVLICNVPGHYKAGMHADFTVTP